MSRPSDRRAELKAMELFLEARELEPAERSSFLERACGSDESLRQRVEALLAADASPLDLREGLKQAARSVVWQLDPVSQETSGVALSDLESDAPLPELELGPDKYQIVGELGEGGMGTVYLAYDRDLRRRVALKMIRQEARLERFIEEAQVLGQLQHPNIVPVLEIGLSGDRLFYTMPVVRGRSLREILSDLGRADAPDRKSWSLGRLMQVFVQICQAVAFAHAKGVVHRDLKPENVLLGTHNEVQVLDWGLSKVFCEGSRQSEPGLPERSSGRLVGTPGYIPPEQIEGKEVDARSDVWALGVILYELLTHTRPFDGTAAATIAAILHDEAEAPRRRAPELNIPLELEASCLKALSKPPDERHGSVSQLLAEVQTWLEAEADRTKRHELAEAKAAEGRANLESWWRLKRETAHLEAEVQRLVQHFQGWQAAAEKQPLCEARDRLREHRKQLIGAASRTVARLHEALAFEPEHGGAREALADTYWDRLRECEAGRDDEGLGLFTELLSSYHDGRYSRELEGSGSLTLDSEPSGARVWLHENIESGFVITPAARRSLGTTPLGPVPLAMGSYLVGLELEGYRETSYPVFISRNREWAGSVRLYRDEQIGQGFIYIPAGPFICGGDQLLPGCSLPLSEPFREDFFIAERPVTMGEYLEFLNDLAARYGRQTALSRAPRPAAPGAPTYLLDGPAGTFALPEQGPEGDRWDKRKPALGISWHDAMAYCAWKSQLEGQQHRLPSEIEWEKAARGVDGRSFPWGNRFDASLCNMRDSRRQREAPVPVDEFPADLSIYGVRGLGGNVSDWTETVHVEGAADTARHNRVSRGGAWGHDETACRSANRAWLSATSVADDLGFRLVRPAADTR